MRAMVSVVEPLGSDTLVHFEHGGARHVARVGPDTVVQPGQSLTFAPLLDKIHLFDRGEGNALR